MSKIRVELVPGHRSGAGKLSRVVRLKDYYKRPEDREVYVPVPEVACHETECTLREAAKVAMVDTVGCPLNCWWCYQRGRSVETADLLCDDIAHEFGDFAHDVPAWRITGGEPTLHDALPELIELMADKAEWNHILWLNTNGHDPSLIPDFGALISLDVKLFVELSIKGFTPELAVWNAQAEPPPYEETISELYALGHDVFLNVCPLAPDSIDIGEKYDMTARFGKSLQAIHPALPLVVTVIRPKHYGWIPTWRDDYVSLRDQWELWLTEEYHWLDLMTPQHLWARQIAGDLTA